MKKTNQSRKKATTEFPYITTAKRAGDAALKEVAIVKQVMILPNYISFKVLVTLIKAMLTNIGRPGTNAEEVKKDLKAANPEVDVPINVDSRPLPGYPSFSAH